MKGILCLQVGTPDTPAKKDVARYLKEFLTDPCIIEKPWLVRQILVRGIIVPLKKKGSSENYGMIWQEGGSPLKVYTEKLVSGLKHHLGADYAVTYGMGYQNPAIEKQLHHLMQLPLKELVILPLFPQYAKATTGSVLSKTFDVLKKYREIPSIRVVSSFEDHPLYIDALHSTLIGYNFNDYDQIIISFHSLPLRVAANYKERCMQTAKALAKKANIQHYTVSFQSKLGREPWIGPSTNEVLNRWKRVLVICPSFVSDCVETIHEIGIEEKEEFFEKGGERFDLVPCLNDHPNWIQALAAIATG